MMSLIGTIVFWGCSGELPAVRAAETVVLRSGESQTTVALEDIQQLAETGEVPSNLEDLARILSPIQRSQILNALQANLNSVDGTAVSGFLNTEMGERLVRAIAALTPKKDLIQHFYLRRALINAANDPKGLSLVSFIAAYPQESLELNLDKAFLVAQNFNRDFWQTQAFMSAIAPKLTPNTPNVEIPFDATQLGNQRVQRRSFTLTDRARDRAIPLDLYFSNASTQNKPLIIFSHGLFSVNEEMIYLAEHLASYGYVVAVPEHPRSNGTHLEQVLKFRRELLDPQEFLNRPRDISFILDEFNRLNRTSRQFRGKLSTDNVLVLGYSLGGSTALSLAGAELQLEELKEWCEGRDILASNLGLSAQCRASGLPENRYQLRDPRIKGAIALAPTTSLLFGETGLAQIQVPTLIAAASADKTAPALPEQIVGFTKMSQPKWLVGIIGGTHLSFKDPLTTTDQAGQPDTLYSGGEVVAERAFEVRNYVKAITLAMAAQLTSDAEEFAVFLTSDYAQLTSTPRFSFRLVREIPPEVEALIPENSK
ncbi:alpha/beta hydrolase [Lusitaniella coriacea LEGE 07157]|uniref:Alpha/beta hydrolase n=1 Tax=Lusitaniella coriacea LEGE 07157 TaxID=945747 RepID=A0A8J7JFF2_9CYAN|nr:alpha/beta hydrolase [Lusitaniella coriacea]MBE9118725.1 alpha/beta hydrolase [Lusitaniella coriacea LEGE 07157]